MADNYSWAIEDKLTGDSLMDYATFIDRAGKETCKNVPTIAIFDTREAARRYLRESRESIKRDIPKFVPIINKVNIVTL